MLLQEVETEDAQKFIGLKHLQHAAALNYQVPKAFDHHWKASSDLVKEVSRLYFPWIYGGKPTVKQAEYEEYKELLTKEYGDPNDPKVKERIKKTVEYLQSFHTKEKSKGVKRG